MIPAAVVNSWFFWLAIVGFVIGIYTLPTVIAIALQVEGIGWVICLNTIPAGADSPAVGLPDATHTDQSRSSPAEATRVVGTDAATAAR